MAAVAPPVNSRIGSTNTTAKFRMDAGLYEYVGLWDSFLRRRLSCQLAEAADRFASLGCAALFAVAA